MTATHQPRQDDSDIDLHLNTDEQPEDEQPEDEQPEDEQPETEAADDKPRRPNPLKRAATRIGEFITACKVWTRQPTSFDEAWQRSGDIDMDRVPDQSDFFAFLWLLSNRTDRYIWFGLYFIAPASLAGGVLYLAERPTRRWGAVIAIVLVTVCVPKMLR